MCCEYTNREWLYNRALRPNTNRACTIWQPECIYTITIPCAYSCHRGMCNAINGARGLPDPPALLNVLPLTAIEDQLHQHIYMPQQDITVGDGEDEAAAAPFL